MSLNATANQILDLAEEKIKKTGINDFSYKDLQKEIGLRTSSIHYYFPTKQDLILSLIKRHTDKWRQIITTLNKEHKKGLQRLEAFVSLYTQECYQSQWSLAGSLASDAMALAPEVRLELQEFYLIIEMWVVQALILAKENSEIKRDIQPHKAACLWLSCLEGGFLIARLTESKEYLQKTLEQIIFQFAV
jgi:TetR/AcrR family transcriptional repressor of nem operon